MRQRYTAHTSEPKTCLGKISSTLDILCNKIHLPFRLALETSVCMYSCLAKRLRAALLMCVKRAGPSMTPPNQRETTTKTFLASVIWSRCSKRAPAADSPSSSQSYKVYEDLCHVDSLMSLLSMSKALKWLPRFHRNTIDLAMLSQCWVKLFYMVSFCWCIPSANGLSYLYPDSITGLNAIGHYVVRSLLYLHEACTRCWTWHGQPGKFISGKIQQMGMYNFQAIQILSLWFDRTCLTLLFSKSASISSLTSCRLAAGAKWAWILHVSCPQLEAKRRSLPYCLIKTGLLIKSYRLPYSSAMQRQTTLKAVQYGSRLQVVKFVQTWNVDLRSVKGSPWMRRAAGKTLKSTSVPLSWVAASCFDEFSGSAASMDDSQWQRTLQSKASQIYSQELQGRSEWLQRSDKKTELYTLLTSIS